MENPLSKIVLDYWYKVLMVVGIAAFLLTGAGILKAFPTVPTAFVSLGVFWVGVGEWVNHPLQTRIHPVGIVTGHPRNPKFIGLLFDVIGLGLIALGLYKFLA